MAATGVAAHDIELAKICDGVDVELYRPAMETAGELGVRHAICSVWTGDFAYATDSLARLCDLARPCGVTVNLDPIAQSILAAATIVAFLICNRASGRSMTLFLTLLSCLVSLRYIVWRFTETLEFNTVLQGALGIGLAFVRDSNHFGAISPYSYIAAIEGFATVIGTNASVTIAPTGGKEARLGNNPITFRVPNPGGAAKPRAQTMRNASSSGSDASHALPVAVAWSTTSRPIGGS